VINRFATDPPPQEPASSMLIFSLSWVHANGNRHLCNTSAIRDCEAHRTSYLYVFITSKQSGIPCSLQLTLLSCKRPGCTLISLCANASDEETATSPQDSRGRTPIVKRENERLKGARGVHRHRQQGVFPSSFIWARPYAQRFTFSCSNEIQPASFFLPLGLLDAGDGESQGSSTGHHPSLHSQSDLLVRSH
jgi:hypothetical protein